MMRTRIYSTALAALAIAFASLATAQEQSVKPGINERFKNDPSVQTFTTMFEGESRAIFANRHAIVDALQLKEGMAVADVGAGTGFFTIMMGDRVGEDGVVYAVDIAENFIDHIAKRAKEEDLSNVETVLCTDRSAELQPESVDLVYICDTYHHFEFPSDTLASIHSALRPDGRLVVVDFERIVGISSEWTLNHVRCGKGTVTDEIKDAGFDFVEEIDLMDEQYVLVFEKRTPAE